MRLHERYHLVQEARLGLSGRVIEWLDAYPDLTYVEAMQCLQAEQDSLLRYALRAERHPDDPDKKADEA